MIRNYLLSSAATFSPPDAPGADSGGTDQVADLGGSPEPAGGSPEGGDAPAGGAAPEPAPKEDHAKPRVETVGESVRRATAETKEKAEAAAKAKTTKAATKAKDSTQAGAETGDPAKPVSETTAEGNTETAPQAQSAAPKAWSKEEKALWNDLPEAARAAITRREADTEKGVNELRTRYQEIDTAIAPYKAVMTQNNVTPGQAINQLFKWHMELAGPNKVEAFRQLAKSFGVDPATIAAAPATTEKPADANPDNSIPENLRPVITNLETRLKTFEERESAAMQNAAKQTWQNWSKDKPHAETVRGLMANLINSDLALIQAGQPQISNTIKNGSIDMDAAYEAAKYAHPEVRAALIQEDQAKRDKEARAAAEKARKAGASLKSGAPAGPISASSNAAPRNETVAESIKRALAEVRGTQH
jgi:hypothetical protein